MKISPLAWAFQWNPNFNAPPDDELAEILSGKEQTGYTVMKMNHADT
jgi:hypothetical protein